MRRRRFLFAAVLAVAGGLIAPSTSQAAFLLKFDSTNASGAHSVTLNLSGTNDGNPNTIDVVSGSGASGAGWKYDVASISQAGDFTTVSFVNMDVFGYVISFSISKTNAPDGNPGDLLLNNFSAERYTAYGTSNVTNGGAATSTQNGAVYDSKTVTTGANRVAASNARALSGDNLAVTLTATDYHLPPSQTVMESRFTGSFDNSAGSTSQAVYSSIYDRNNTLFGAVTSLIHSDTLTKGGSLPGETDTPITPAGTSQYSITNKLALTNIQTSSLQTGFTKGLNGASVQTTITGPVAAPAPAGLILVAGIVPFIGLLRRRLRAAAPAVAV